MARNGSNWPKNKWFAVTLERSSVSLSSMIGNPEGMCSIACTVLPGEREIEREGTVENGELKLSGLYRVL